MPEFVIREATDEDGPALAELFHEIWSRYEGCAFEPEDPELFERPASWFAERGGRLWVVMRDGAVAGSLGVARHARPQEFALSMICLDEPSRGQGLATALLAGADAFAAASEGTRLNLWIDQRLADGVRFLERQGFLRDPGVRQHDDGSGALQAHYSKEVRAEVSLRLSEAPPAGAA
jgi:putative acetyltransferase